MSHFADSEGMPRRCCVIDHDDHIHLIYRCSCPKNCEPQDVVVPITLDMLLQVYPENRLHIHERKGKPTQESVIEALPVRVCGMMETGACSICCGGCESGDVVTMLPCGHEYHKDCISPWLHRA